MDENFLTLGIESSCDDTGVAVLRGQNEVLAADLSSQISSHTKYGGVVPELASRMHQEAIIPLLNEVLERAGVKDPMNELNLIAVTAGPGLVGSLMVGVMTAKGLAQGWNVPLIGVNHLEGHIFANFAAHSELTPPFISVVVSGGHTEVISVKDFGIYELLGSTRDDAAGEAYDKVAKVQGLGYPGGPVIDKMARMGDADRYKLPVPLAFTDKVEFSFSGLKTAAVTLLQKTDKSGEKLNLNDFCASFQKAVVTSLCKKIALAVKQTGVKKVTISGGVAANSGLRDELSSIADKNGWALYLPPRAMCTDNAVMVAAAGYNSFKRGNVSDLRLTPDPSWEIW